MLQKYACCWDSHIYCMSVILLCVGRPGGGSCLRYVVTPCCAVAIAEAQAICSTPCTAVAQAVASVPSVYECATGDPNNATDAAKAQATSLGVPSKQVMMAGEICVALRRGTPMTLACMELCLCQGVPLVALWRKYILMHACALMCC